MALLTLYSEHYKSELNHLQRLTVLAVCLKNHRPSLVNKKVNVLMSVWQVKELIGNTHSQYYLVFILPLVCRAVPDKSQIAWLLVFSVPLSFSGFCCYPCSIFCQHLLGAPAVIYCQQPHTSTSLLSFLVPLKFLLGYPTSHNLRIFQLFLLMFSRFNFIITWGLQLLLINILILIPPFCFLSSFLLIFRKGKNVTLFIVPAAPLRNA